MRQVIWPSLGSLLFTACAAATGAPEVPPLALSFATDTLRAAVLGPGVTHRYIYSSIGPWAIHVLEVALDQCYRAVAVKGAPGAIGREKTSTLLENLARSEAVIGGVNADFFLFTPSGVPQGALVSGGRVISGPSDRPVLAFDSAGTPHLVTLQTVGSATVGGRQFRITGWNRAVPDGLALFDSGWGRATDTASATVEVLLSGNEPPAVLGLDTATTGVEIPAAGAVLVAGRRAAADMRAALLALRQGDSVRIELALSPFHPREAVGGRPLLVRDSAVVADVESAGQPGFAAARHPRTAAGIGSGGNRLLLVTVDGRQKPYSDGMTLRELANLLLALGAREAINLDGGGSTTLVYADPDSAGRLRVANQPSDSAGERRVGDAFAIVQGCATR